MSKKIDKNKKQTYNITGRLVLDLECPFYISGQREKITCEGMTANSKAIQQFNSVDEKNDHLRNFCCKNRGEDCPHYKMLMKYIYGEDI